MNLDDLSRFKALDPQDMLGHIDGLPDQLQSAWNLSQTQPLDFADGLRPSANDVRQIVICGMGGSAIGADLVAAAVMENCLVPIIVHRDYGLPAFARGTGTLVICSSHSGNTEETLDAFETALRNDCRVLAVSTSGELSEKARETGLIALIESPTQSRNGYSRGAESVGRRDNPQRPFKRRGDGR